MLALAEDLEEEGQGREGEAVAGPFLESRAGRHHPAALDARAGLTGPGGQRGRKLRSEKENPPMKLRILSLLLALTALFSASVLAATLEINGVGRHDTLTLQGEDLEINGTAHQLTIKGRVSRLEINGTGHRITVLASVGDVEVNGTGNQVDLQGKVSDIEVNGMDNSVTWSRAQNPTPPDIDLHGVNNSAKGR
jgi:hypothetical protein